MASRDTTNLKPLDGKKPHESEHFRIRFKYLDPLSGNQKVLNRHWVGDLLSAQTERDRLRICLRNGIDPDSQKGQGVGGSVDLPKIPHSRGGALGSATPPRAPRGAHEVSLNELRDVYIRERKRRGGQRKRALSPKTIQADERALDVYVLPQIGQVLIQRLTPSRLEDLIDHWIDAYPDLSPATINGQIRTLRHFIKWGAKRSGIYNPASDLELLPAPKKVRTSAHAKATGQALDSKAAVPAEKIGPLLSELRKSYPQHYALAYVSLYAGGLRWGSVSALMWSDIDDVSETLIVQRSQNLGNIKEGSKTGFVHAVPLEPLQDALDFQRSYLGGSKRHPSPSECDWIFPCAVHATTGVRPDSWLQIYSSGFTKCLKKACESIGIEGRSHHALRNTFVSLAGASGASQAVMESMTGHSSVMSTHYTTTSAEQKGRLIESVRTLAGAASHKANVRELEAKAESLEDALADLPEAVQARILAALEGDQVAN